MATSYNFTKDFFFTKLRMILRRPASRPYRRRTAFGLEWLGFMSGRYLSSSTLVIQPLDYDIGARIARSEEHTSELQSLMRSTSAVCGLLKKKLNHTHQHNLQTLPPP